MATILYKDGKPEKVSADNVQACLKSGYTTTPEKQEEKKPRKPRKAK